MSTPEPKGPLLKEALNQAWPLAGSELFTHTGKSANRLDNPKLLWTLLQDAFTNQRIHLHQRTLPQLHQLDTSLSLSHKILNRLAFVDLYYEQLAQHSYLDEEVLQLLYRLRPAIVQAILHSDSILANPKHPLRKVLSDLCTWGIGWDKNIGRAGEKYYNLLNNLVLIGNTLPEDPSSDALDAYTTTLNTLADLAVRHKQLEERICENEKAVMDNAAISKQVEMVINEVVAGNPVPPISIEFFHTLWRDMLHRIRVLHTTDSTEWQAALKTMEQLIFCLAPQPNSKQEQINLIPSLIQSLKRMLQESGLDASNAYLFDNIVSVFKQIMTGETIPLEIAPPLSTRCVAGVSTTISSSISEQVTQLTPGQWILCKGENGEMTRGRLARIFPEAEQALFVNLTGAKPFSKNIEELGLALNTKRAYLLVSHNLSDILLSLTVDLFIKEFRKAVPQSTPQSGNDFRKQSAEKALAEAKKLREAAEAKPAPTPLPEEEGGNIEKLVNELKIGSWVSMKNRLDEQMPCKIAVIYASTGKMVITDKAGLRVGEFLRPQLVELIMQGEASILEMADSFESSLSRVLQTLRKNT